jgi:hypothetical protein
VDTTPIDINSHKATLSVYGNIFFTPSVITDTSLTYEDTLPNRERNIEGNEVKKKNANHEL